MHGGPLKIEESIGSPQTGVTDSFEPLGTESCPLEEQEWALNH